MIKDVFSTASNILRDESGANFGDNSGDIQLGEWYNEGNLEYDNFFEFIKSEVKIIDKQSRKISFELNAEQEYFVRNMRKRNTTLKGRQIGSTTIVSIIALYFALINDNYRVVVVSKDKGLAGKIIGVMGRIFLDFSNVVKAKIVLINGKKNENDECMGSVDSLIFNNGSSITASTSSRGHTCNFLFSSDATSGRRGTMQETITGSTESVSLFGRFNIQVFESTSVSDGGANAKELFLSYCRLAKRNEDRGDTNWKFFMFFWHKHEEYRLDYPPLNLTSHQKEYFSGYFSGVEIELGDKLSEKSRNWYMNKAVSEYDIFNPISGRSDSLKSEHPSTAEEVLSVSVSTTILGKTMSQLHTNGNIREDELFMEGRNVFCIMDFDIEKPSSFIFIQHAGGSRYNVINCIKLKDTTLEKVSELIERLRSKLNYMIPFIILPHDLNKRTPAGGTWVDYFNEQYNNIRAYGLQIESVEKGIIMMKDLLPDYTFKVPECNTLLESLTNATYDSNKSSRVPVVKHDKHSHFFSAMRYFISNTSKIKDMLNRVSVVNSSNNIISLPF